MRIDLNDPNPPVKCYFDDEAPDAGYVLLRRMTAAEAKRIRRACAKRQPAVFHRGQMYEPPEQMDETKQSEMHWDYVIAGWEGLEDSAGTPIPCTLEMKKKLVLESPRFMAFVADKLEQLELLNKDTSEEQKKNS